MTLSAIFLQAGSSAPYANIILLVGMVLVFWLFMIRPQAKKAKMAKQFQQNMQKGERIVTIAGIHGVVNKVNDDGTIMLETSPGIYLKVEKTAISMEWTNQINKNAATQGNTPATTSNK